MPRRLLLLLELGDLSLELLDLAPPRLVLLDDVEEGGVLVVPRHVLRPDDQVEEVLFLGCLAAGEPKSCSVQGPRRPWPLLDEAQLLLRRLGGWRLRHGHWCLVHDLLWLFLPQDGCSKNLESG